MDGLRRLVYRSRPTLLFSPPRDLNAILAQSASHNARWRITGALAAFEGRFVQVLEGQEGPLAALMERIVADPRHQNLTILENRPICARLFAGWAMARVSACGVTDRTRSLILETGTAIEVAGLMMQFAQPQSTDAFGI